MTAVKKTPAKKPAAAAKAPAKKASAKPKAGGFEIDVEALTATNDWPLYTVSTYVRAKQVTENTHLKGKPIKAGQYVVVTKDFKASIVDADKFEAEYEVVKGPHKQEF